jgi:hypothetical protein
VASASISEAARSASFSVPERDFAGFLRESLAVLAREMPAAHERMGRLLASRTVVLRVDGGAITLTFGKDGAYTHAAGAATADVEIESARATILGVIDGETSLAEAVLDERLLMRGRLDDVVAFHDALVAYVHGAVRAPSFPALLRAYRAKPREGRRDG